MKKYTIGLITGALLGVSAMMFIGVMVIMAGGGIGETIGLVKILI